MTKGGANFTSEELALVLSHYQLGTIDHVAPLVGGNRKAPKKIITTQSGKFVIKRRPKGKDDPYRVAFSHSVQQQLNEKNFPVPVLVLTRDEKNTALNLNDHIYEMFEYIEGQRCDGSSESAEDAGKTLALFHKDLEGFACQFDALKKSFHDSTLVRGHLRSISKHKVKNGTPKLIKLGEKLSSLYNHSSTNVNTLDFDNWPAQIIHGDWHPGNMLFKNQKVVAVLDFDSIKIAPVTCDLANGMLHFSIVGGRPNPADWPDYLNLEKLKSFYQGYCDIIKLPEEQIDALPDLMIETMIAEAVLPIAATGFFGYLSGEDFLKMIARKCTWIHIHKADILNTIK